MYVLNVGCFRSGDGGKTFEPIRTPHGDNHDLWIDPDEPARMIEGNDGGATVTVNGGRSWSSLLNQPTAQFYRVVTDGRFPYRVFGAQQDNTTVEILSRTRGRGIGPSDWHPVGGCESGWIAPKPGDPDVSFAGCYGGEIDRYDHRTGESRDVVAWPQLAIGQAPKDLKYRFQWNAPILVSPHPPHALYHAAQVLLKSTDDGATWTEISPDLTRNDKATQGSSGGPITFDNTGVEVYGVIFALAESPHEAGTIWAGSDDGLVHLTRDGGQHWADVTPKGLPVGIQVNSIEVSPHDAAAAWIAATMYKHDDARPYLYRTADYGRTWTKLVAGIPDGAFTRVVREDPVRKGLALRGDRARPLRFVRRRRRVAAVSAEPAAGPDHGPHDQGRRPRRRDAGPRVLDPRRPLAAEAMVPCRREAGDPPVQAAIGRPFRVGRARRRRPAARRRAEPARRRDRRRLAEGRAAEEAGAEGRAHARGPRRREGAPDVHVGEARRRGRPRGARNEDAEKPLELKQGLNRFAWDLRMLKPSLVPKAIIWGPRDGPLVAPGTYTVRIRLGGTTLTDSVEVRANPMVKVSAEDLKKQSAFLARVRDDVSATHEAALTCRDVKKQVKEVAERAAGLGKKEPLAGKGKALSEKLTAIEDKLVNPKVKSEQDVLNFPPQLDHQFVGVASVAGSGEGAPAASSVTYLAELEGRLGDLKKQLQSVLDTDLADFNRTVQEQGIPAVAPAPAKGKKRE